MNQPLVSVIIAVKNGERYLPHAMDSVRAQTYENYEVIVVDGQSTDNTERIARSYPRTRFLGQSGQGLAAAWNTGLAAAHGELIAFLDHDDYWPPHKLSLQVDYLTRHPEIQFVIGRVKFFLEPGYAVPGGFKRELFEGDHLGRIPGTLMARKPLFDEIGGFRTDLVIASDVEWFAQAKDHNVPMAIIPEVLLYKRVHETNLASDARIGNRELLAVLRESIKRQQR
jgi:glycosyltransferase involved in cell wall biosynthesis